MVGKVSSENVHDVESISRMKEAIRKRSSNASCIFEDLFERSHDKTTVFFIEKSSLESVFDSWNQDRIMKVTQLINSKSLVAQRGGE